MAPKKLIYSALALAFCAGQAQAIGFGEIALHSRIGENLRAEVPLYVSPGEVPQLNCFKLIRDDASDLPPVTSASLRLLHNQGGYQLGILSNRPVRHPLFTISISANCGMDLQRTYLLMPDPPIFQVVDSLQADTGNPAEPNIRLAAEGETLAGIAASLAGGNAGQQGRMLASLQRANPDFAADDILGEGTEIRIPASRQRLASRPEGKPDSVAQRLVQRQTRLATQAARQIPAKQPAPQPGQTTDRVIVGLAPIDLPVAGKPVGNKAASETVTLGEIEERILKLETTLHTLHEEVLKLDDALVEANAAMAERNRLQLAQQIDTPSIRSSLPTPSPKQDSTLELLISATAGGLIAVLFARFLSRRQERLAEQEMPLTMNGYHPEIYVTPPPPEPLAEASPPALPEIFDPAAPEENEFSRLNPLAPEFRVAEVEPYNQQNDLDLVEILLASGRERGAAEILSMYIDDNSPDELQPWKQLLELYRQCDMRSEFEALRPRIREKFNVELPDWPITTPPPVLQPE